MRFFVNDLSFCIKERTESKLPEYEGLCLRTFSNTEILNVYLDIKDRQLSDASNFFFEVEDPSHTERYLLNYFKKLQAGGGVVTKDGKVLFIKRLGKWDLPKGKLEGKEMAAQAALREVSEETGVSGSLKGLICETFHTYTLKEEEILKQTFWYHFECKDDSKLKPQEEESITEVRWMSDDEIKSEVLPDTYESIREVLRRFREKIQN